MLAIPIKQAGREWLILVMDQNNLDRLQKADPMEFDVGATGLKSPTILIAFERDQAAVARFIQTADLGGLIKHLQRVWEFRPDLGDHDRGPESIKDLQ